MTRPRISQLYPNRVRILPRGLLIDYSALIESETEKKKIYHTNVRLRITPDSRYNMDPEELEQIAYEAISRLCGIIVEGRPDYDFDPF